MLQNGLGSRQLDAIAADEEMIDLSWASDRPDPRLRRLVADGAHCFKLADVVRDPKARRMLIAVGEALWALADEGVHFVPEDYRLGPALDDFFRAVRSGSVRWAAVRRLAFALRFTSRHLRFADSRADCEQSAIRNAERALKRAAREIVWAKAVELRKVLRPDASSPLRLLVVSLTVAPAAPPVPIQI